MNVLLHCIYYPPEVGGLESHVHQLARGLAERGHSVRVVTSRSIQGAPAEEVLEGVRVARTWFPMRNPVGWVLHSLASLPRTQEWARWADVVHAQAFASIPPCGIATAAADRPFVATFHTSHFLVRATRPLWRSLLGRLVAWPDHVLAASAEIAGVAGELAPGHPVEPLTNGVDTHRFRPVPPVLPEDEIRGTILLPRRLFQKNGVEFAVRALPRILKEVPHARLLVVGDGPERPRLEALAVELGVADRIRFLGRRPHEEMPGLLCSGEIALFPSLMEATSVAALEAMACGRPVVATRVGGLPEIVDESVGTLVPPGDPEGLATGVVELLRRPDLEAVGRRARRRVVRHWSNDRLVERHLEVYGALVEGRPVPEPRHTEAEAS
jgi:glycosyltransferase involved in cell wall biosynthesis